MNEEKFPKGTRVKNAHNPTVGTSQGYNQIQNGGREVLVIFDNGRRESIEEVYLREATEEDEAKSADWIQRSEEAARHAEERRENKRRLHEENEAKRQQRKQEEAEAEEEARQLSALEYTEEMRKVNGRLYGLESLRRK